MNWPGMSALKWVQDPYVKSGQLLCTNRVAYGLVLKRGEDVYKIRVKVFVDGFACWKDQETQFPTLAEAKAACEAWLTNHYGEAPSEGREVTE